MPPLPLEAWIHRPEREPTNEQKEFLTHLFYGENDTSYILPTGYTKFCRRVWIQQKNFPEEVITYFYNRQTAVQIFFRFTKDNLKRTKIKNPLIRSDVAFTELQLDVLSYTAPRPPRARREEGRRTINTKILVAVDPSSRFAFARMYPHRENYENIWGSMTARLLIAMVPEEIQRRIQRLRMDAGTEFRQDFRNTIQNESQFPENLQILQTNKAAMLLGQNSPANMGPIEAMVRTLREYMERYRRFSHSAAPFPSNQSLEYILRAYNSENHSAFKNKMTPEVAANAEMQPRLQHFIDINNEKARENLNEIEPLKVGEIVRIMRRLDTMTKQSLPKVTYDLYRVQSIRGVEVTVLNLRTRQNRPFPVHITRVVRVKLNSDDSSDDPPNGTRYAAFLDAIFREQREEYADDDYKIRVGIGQEREASEPLERVDVELIVPHVRPPSSRIRRPSLRVRENQEQEEEEDT